MSLTQVQKYQRLIARAIQENEAATVAADLEKLLDTKERKLLSYLQQSQDRIATKKQIENEAYQEGVKKANALFAGHENDKTTFTQQLKLRHIKALKAALANGGLKTEQDIAELTATQNALYQNDLTDAILSGWTYQNTDVSKLNETQLRAWYIAELKKREGYKELSADQAIQRALKDAQLDLEDKRKRERLTFGKSFFAFFSALHQAKGFALSCGFTMGGALLMLLSQINGPSHIMNPIMLAAMPLSLIIVWTVTRANWWICNQVVPKKFIDLFCDKENTLRTWKDLFEKLWQDLKTGNWTFTGAAKKSWAFGISFITASVWAVFTFFTSKKLLNTLGSEFADIFGAAFAAEYSFVVLAFSGIMALYTIPTFFCVCLSGWKKNTHSFFPEYKAFWNDLKNQTNIKNKSFSWVKCIAFAIVALTLLGLFTTAIASTPGLTKIFGGSDGANIAAYIVSCVFGFLGAAAFYEHMSRDAVKNVVNWTGEEGGEFTELKTLKDEDPCGLYATPDYSKAIKEHREAHGVKESFWQKLSHLWLFTTKKSFHDKGVIGLNGGFQGLPSAVGGGSMPQTGITALDWVLSLFYGASSAAASYSVNSGGNQQVSTYENALGLDEHTCDDLAQAEPSAIRQGIQHYRQTHPVDRPSWSLWGNCTPAAKDKVAEKLEQLSNQTKITELTANQKTGTYTVNGLTFSRDELSTARDGHLGHHARLLAHQHPALKPVFCP